ncbi:MAG TPA: mechanosensitive ion channel family protein [Gemmatimonas sp.]|nr:mechanosensitive ion channel family protein [Gemmatimonas sp.]
MQLLLTIPFLMIAAAAAQAAPVQDERTTVRVDGRPVFRIGPADSSTAAQRALRVERRLGTLLQTPRALPSAQIAPAGADRSDRVITVAGVPVITVTRADADDNVTSADGLALQWSRVLDTELRRAGERRLSGRGRFAAEVQASVQAAFSRLLESAIRIVPRVLAALLVLVLFWLLASGVRFALRALFARVIEDRTVESLVKQGAYYTIWTLGLIVAVDALGFQPQTVVTGLGLTGLALGFALKDIISNFVSGLLLLALRPFELGDQIVVGDTEGSVERIELRATQIRTYDGRLVLVPNAELFISRVTNNTASPVRRAVVPLFLGYDSDLPLAVEVVRRAVTTASGVLPDPPVAVRVAELGQDDLVLEARFWTDSRRSDFTATQAIVRAEIVRAFRDANIGLPDPNVRVLVPRHPERWRVALGPEGDDSDRTAPPGNHTQANGRSERRAE